MPQKSKIPLPNNHSKTVATTCAYCGVGCGIKATVNNADLRDISIKGDESHPANFGRLCSKGSALGETVVTEGRLLAPMIGGQQVAWDTAISHVADKFKQIIVDHGPDAVAFYVSGQLLTEDYYVANKLMKGFIGSANIDTNSRLCMSSAVAAHKRAFGEDIVPGNYEDFDEADLIVLTGSNTAWCHPIIFQRIRQAKANNPNLSVVVIDPRKTATCDIADLHLPIKPGSDVALFNGLLARIAQQGRLNLPYLENHVTGFANAVNAARISSPDIESVARQCGLNADDVSTFFDWFAQTEKTVTAFSQGVNQSSSGTDKGNAIINCHLATGRLGLPGATAFSLTGQPNAMGGREVGGLANQLAAHMDFDPEDVDRVGRFWQTDNMATKPGLKVLDMFRAIEAGSIKAVWIIATNPVVSLPDADRIKAALQGCEFVVVSDCMEKTDTTACAQVLLPARGWAEQDGTVTNSERRISRQRSFLPPLAESKPDWWIISEVAKAMGYGAAFNYRHPAQIFDEHARLSAFENNSSGKLRLFNLDALIGLSQTAYNTMAPQLWPVSKENPQGQKRFFADGGFNTADGKARMVALSPKPPTEKPSHLYPFVLNTGRIRDQWHSMTRTALSSRLNQHKPEPFVEIHPDDAKVLGLAKGDLATLSSTYGSMLARVDITDSQQTGSLFVPMHWTAQLASQGRVGALVNPIADPISGQPESKHTPVAIKRFEASWCGFVLSRRKLNGLKCTYRVTNPGTHYYRYELADNHPVNSWPEQARGWLCSPNDPPEWIDYLDKKAGSYRGARLIANKLESVAFISTNAINADSAWLTSLFEKEALDQTERMSLLSGKPPKGAKSIGKVICACFNVGQSTITDAIKSENLKDVAAVGKCLQAGTNCGSCIPELQQLLNTVNAA